MKIVSAIFAAALAVSAHGVVTAPLAPGYPVWHGLMERNRISGRSVCPSDMRHRAVMVVKFDAHKVEKNFAEIVNLASRVQFTTQTTSWMAYELPTDGVVLLVNTGKKITEAEFDKLVKSIKDEKNSRGRSLYSRSRPPLYENAGFLGEPEAGKAEVYAYVLEPNASEPAWKGEVTEKTVKAAADAFKKAMAKSPEWKPFFGTLTRDNHPFPEVVKAIDSGKPVARLYPKMLAAVKGKDEAKAKAAQLAYDALERTRSDYICRIEGEMKKSPATAYADMQELLRFWPGARKELGDAEKTIKRNKDGVLLGKALARAREMGAAGFTVKSESELKKLKSELERLTASFAKLKDSEDLSIQSDASILSSIIETVESELPSKVQHK